MLIEYIGWEGKSKKKRLLRETIQVFVEKMVSENGVLTEEQRRAAQRKKVP